VIHKIVEAIEAQLILPLGFYAEVSVGKCHLGAPQVLNIPARQIRWIYIYHIDWREPPIAIEFDDQCCYIRIYDSPQGCEEDYWGPNHPNEETTLDYEDPLFSAETIQAYIDYHLEAENEAKN